MAAENVASATRPKANHVARLELAYFRGLRANADKLEWTLTSRNVDRHSRVACLSERLPKMGVQARRCYLKMSTMQFPRASVEVGGAWHPRLWHKNS